MEYTEEYAKAAAIANEWYTPVGVPASEMVEFSHQEGPVYYFHHSKGDCFVDSTDWSHGESA